MLLAISAILVGLPILAWGADRFVTGAAGLAHNLGVSALLIGLTVVGFGTSAPEILVSAMAAYQGNPRIAVGSALGSNIANIGLILGATALVAPLLVKSHILRLEYPLLLGVTVAAYLLLSDGMLGMVDGAILLGGLVVTLTVIVRVSLRRSDPMATEFEAEIPAGLSNLAAIAWLVIGLALLLLSSRMLVWGAVFVARELGVSNLIIGLTIVAVGTSLPELAASIASALKKEPDIAIGNVIGSNLYNLLAVLCIPGLFSPTPIGSGVLLRDMPVMLGLTLALFVMGRGSRTHGRINRWEGAVLLGVYLAYMGWLILEATAQQAA
jgi:cation:H+ antiporter